MTEGLRTPLIVKPLAEGSSLGITRECVCETAQEVERMVLRLWSMGYDPVLVEEFIQGQEAIVYIAGNAQRYYVRSYENLLEDDELAFHSRPFASDIIDDIGKMKRRSLQVEVARVIETRASDLFYSFSRMHLLGINGRLDMLGQFYFIEMNGFPSIKPGTASFQMFADHGLSYSNFLQILINLALEDYQSLEFDEPEIPDDLFLKRADRQGFPAH